MTTQTTAPATDDTTPVADYDTMSSVFDTLLEPSTPEDDGATPAADTPAPDAPAADAPAADVAEPPAADAPAADAAPAPADAPDDPAPAETDWERRFKELEARVTQQPAAPAPTQEPARQAPQVYSPEENEALEAYTRDWPDVSRGEALVRRKEYVDLCNHIFGEVQRVIGPLVERGVEAADMVGDSTTLQAIREAHNDYNDAMYDSVVAWSDSLTGFRQRLAKTVIAEGDVEDVIDLIAEFKRETGAGKPKVVADAAPSPASKATNVTSLPDAAKKAAKALGVVETKRTAVTPAATDPNDFDSAWDEAVAK